MLLARVLGGSRERVAKPGDQDHEPGIGVHDPAANILIRHRKYSFTTHLRKLAQEGGGMESVVSHPFRKKRENDGARIVSYFAKNPRIGCGRVRQVFAKERAKDGKDRQFYELGQGLMCSAKMLASASTLVRRSYCVRMRLRPFIAMWERSPSSSMRVARVCMSASRSEGGTSRPSIP